MADFNPVQEEQLNTEQKQKQQLKDSILSICEPMCFNILKEKPKDIAFFMINWLQNKYNYSSSLLRNEEKKELQKLKEDIEIFHEMEEHFYFVEQQSKTKKDLKISEKKSKSGPKLKPRLPPDEFIQSDDEEYNNPDEIDPRLDDPDYLESNIKMERRIGTSEIFNNNYMDFKYKKNEKSSELFEFIRINLMKSPLFSELSLDILKKCIDAMEEKNYGPMAEVIKQGDFNDYFYIITEGELECKMGFTIVTREGNRKKVEKFDPKLVKVYYPGDYFGELHLLYHMPVRGTVKSITNSKIFILNRNIYKQILNKSFKDRREKRIMLFRNCPILQTLDDEEYEKLVQISKEAIYQKNETIINENEYINTLMILEEGNCIGTKIIEEGKAAKKTKDYKEGNSFGEEALLKPEKSLESIIASSDVVRFICIDRYTFKNIFGSLEQMLMRNLDLYIKYFPPLPEIVEEVKPHTKLDEETVNLENMNNQIQSQNTAQLENIMDKNSKQENQIPGENNNNIDNVNNINNNENKTIEEMAQKFNNEKEEMKQLYEQNIKLLTDKINDLENQLKVKNDNQMNNNININNNINNEVKNSSNDNNNNMNLNIEDDNNNIINFNYKGDTNKVTYVNEENIKNMNKDINENEQNQINNIKNLNEKINNNEINNQKNIIKNTNKYSNNQKVKDIITYNDNNINNLFNDNNNETSNNVNNFTDNINMIDMNNNNNNDDINNIENKKSMNNSVDQEVLERFKNPLQEELIENMQQNNNEEFLQNKLVFEEEITKQGDEGNNIINNNDFRIIEEDKKIHHSADNSRFDD